MKTKLKFLSALLAGILLMGSVFGVTAVPVFAATVERSIPATETPVTDGVYATPQERVSNMTFYASKYGYEIYADPVTGEVAYVESANPENILLTNPYDVRSNKTSIAEELLSQIIITYSEKTSTSSNKPTLNSYKDAALRGQISITDIRNGIRVSYTIGDLNRRSLVPRQIMQYSFEERILEPLKAAVDARDLSNWDYEDVLAHYEIYGRSQTTSDDIFNRWKRLYPVLEDESVCIYVLAEDVTDLWIAKFQGWIKQYCSTTYSFEQLEADYEEVGYEEKRVEKPLFKAALEYTITESGLSVRLPCNSLQYNMATYALESIQVLPYMGAGNTCFPGYNFYPDGSGSLFDYEQTVTVPAQIYGLDYAYHQISGATYQKAIRMPVYGSVSTEVIHTYKDPATGEVKQVSDFVKSKQKLLDAGAQEITTNTYKRGYVAILEAGESMGTITTTQLGSKAKYATLIPSFNPKPKDTYELDSSLSATGSSNEWTVVSERKYTGNIRILFQLLTDSDKGAAQKIAARAKGNDYLYYEASWLGMAEAYRNYLVANGILTKIAGGDLTRDIPLYMEVFGAIKTQKTIATVPVMVMTPLTTFENVSTMYQYLSGNGVQNVNFKLTGFANGGMYSTMPSYLKWESKVGGASGFRDLLSEARQIELENSNAKFGLYPDFDFAYSQRNTVTDDLDLKKDAVKTIDNRYSSKRIYSATQQTYVSFYQLAISPSRYSKFYNKLLKNLDDYQLQSISVSTLGNALNSDFDEKEPYNREDSKKFTKKALEEISKQYTLMVDSGNAYTWSYVDHIVNADIDSSRYSKASCSVPFLGTVLHGYIQFAGPSLNQEGDPNYMILKSIENGAGMYFVLSYQNTSELKEDAFLNGYYSIDYNIWKNDLVEYYKVLNDLLHDVQSKVIIDHKFLNESDGYGTVRMLDEDELMEQIENELLAAAEEARKQAEQAEIEEKAKIVEAAVYIRNAEDTARDLLDQMKTQRGILEAAFAELNEANVFPNNPNNPKLDPGDLKEMMENFYAAAVNALKAFNYLCILDLQLEVVYNQLPEQLEIMRMALEGTNGEYRYTDAKEIVEALNADDSIRTSARELLYSTPDTDFGTAIANIYNSVLTLLSTTRYTKPEYMVVYRPSLDEVIDAAVYTFSDEGAGEEQTEDQTASATAINNNKVVLVSYGDVSDTQVKTYYKSFILNFNNYSVRTVYGGMEYTIPAYGYAVIYYR